MNNDVYINREQIFLDRLQDKLTNIKSQIEELKNQQEETENKLVENDICPRCFKKLRDDGFMECQYSIKYCNNCMYEHKTADWKRWSKETGIPI